LVDHLADDTVGSGLNGSLRYCINEAANGDAITFGVQGTITLTSGQLEITNSLDIEGPGANQLTISGNHASRVFDISGGATVTIAGLTIANGYTGGDDSYGGGIHNSGTLTVSNSTISDNNSGAFDCDAYSAILLRAYGGGIYNVGTLTISNSTISGNSATAFGCIDEPEQDAVYGGGIYNGATLTVSNSTISDNGAEADPAHWTSYAYGGGIYNVGTLTVSNSTVFRNAARAGGGFFDSESFGGGIYSSGTPTVSNSMIFGNWADAGGGRVSLSGGGGINNYGTLNARNTIIAGNAAQTHPDLSGDLSGDHNLIGGDPRLGPLQNNGGPTKTMALLVGSPALNTGDPTQLGVPDQRGVVRRGGVDIGAYQACAVSLTFSAPDTVTAGMPFDVTVVAIDPYNQPAVGYTGTVHFMASNGAMANYTFTAADGGQHTFRNLVLRRAGPLTITGTDTANASLTGGTTFTITPAAADHLLFLQQPADTAAGHTINPAVTVEVVDQFGNVVTSDNSDTVTLSIGTNPSGGTLSGTLTVTVSGGIAIFSDLSIDLAGDGYTLHATTLGLMDADSGAFSITT
jgi:hypothetical protein